MSAVLDTSALIAFINDEPGQAVVAHALAAGAIACTATMAESSTVLLRTGFSTVSSRSIILALPTIWADADTDLALRAGEMTPLTKPFGLSLGDRFCLALAKREDLPVYTADKIWAKVAAPLGLTVTLIR